MITVTIPAQEYSKEKYIGTGCYCYLEEALISAGYKDVFCFALGRTRIEGRMYKPRESFSHYVLISAFEKGQSVTVNLIKN